MRIITVTGTIQRQSTAAVVWIPPGAVVWNGNVAICSVPVASTHVLCAHARGLGCEDSSGARRGVVSMQCVAVGGVADGYHTAAAGHRKLCRRESDVRQGLHGSVV